MISYCIKVINKNQYHCNCILITNQSTYSEQCLNQSNKKCKVERKKYLYLELWSLKKLTWKNKRKYKNLIFLITIFCSVYKICIVQCSLFSSFFLHIIFLCSFHLNVNSFKIYLITDNTIVFVLIIYKLTFK